MATRLNSNLASWEALEDNFVFRVVSEGLRISFISRPKLITKAKLTPIRPLAPHSLALIRELIKLGIVEDFSGKTFFLNHVFPVPKPSGKFRLILDLKQLNFSVKTPTFTLPSLSKILPYF